MNIHPAIADRLLDWALAEALGGRGAPSVQHLLADRWQRRAAAPRSHAARRWLAAAVVLLATAVTVAVALLERRAGSGPPAQEPAQEPVQEPAPWREAHGPGALAALPKDITHLKCFDMDDAGMAGLSTFTALQALDLSGMDVNEQGYAVSLKISDAGLPALRPLVRLRWLSLQGCHDLRGDGLRHLEELPVLEHLDLTYTGVDAAALGRLERLPSLRELSLSYCGNFPGSALASVAKVVGLRRLDLGGCYTLAGDDVVALAALRELRHLDLSWCIGFFRGQVMGQLPFEGDHKGVHDAAVAALAGLPLETLDLSGCSEITDQGIGALQKMATLHTVGLGSLGRLTKAALDALPAGVESLDLDGGQQWTGGDLSRLRRLTQLHTLGLSGLPLLVDADVAAVLQSHRLRALRLCGAEPRGKMADDGPKAALTTAVASALAAHGSLVDLQLDRAPWLDRDGIAAIARLPALERLGLAANLHLRDADLAPLAAASALRDLRLVLCTGLTAGALRPLQALRLRRLDLGHTRMDAAAVRAQASHWPGCEIVLTSAQRFTVPMPK